MSWPRLRLALLLSLAEPSLRSQWDTGLLRGIVVDSRGQPVAGIAITVQGAPPAFRIHSRSGAGGRFEFVLPYGEYSIRAGDSTRPAEKALQVPPLQTVCLQLLVDAARGAVVPCSGIDGGGAWQAGIRSAEQAGVEPSGMGNLLLSSEPATVTAPLDLTGLAGNPVFLFSHRALSWTAARQSLQGADTSDPYQPGGAATLADTAAIGEVVLRTGFDSGTSAAYGVEAGAFLRALPAIRHAEIASSDTASFLAAGNLPDPATRGLVQQVERYRWFTRDHVLAGGPLGQHTDWLVSGAGQWASQTVPFAPPPSDLATRFWSAGARLRWQMTPRDQIDGSFSGCGARQSDWGVPAGVEALVGRRLAPSFTIAAAEGFAGTAENDGSGPLEAAWNRRLGRAPGGQLQVRFAFWAAHLDTASGAPPGSLSSMDLTGISNQIPPLTNRAGRRRLSVQAGYEPDRLALGRTSHRVLIGAEWQRASSRNRFRAPSDLNLITAAGAAAEVVAPNTPLDSRESTGSFSAYARDEISLWPWLALSLGLVSDAARGSIPAQASQFAARSGVIAWNSVSPRVALAIAPGRFQRLVLRASYARLVAPLTGRYLDFGNPNSLGGLVYPWLDSNRDGRFQADERGPLLAAFGGPYQSVDRHLRRPYADELNLGAEAALPWNSHARLWLFRRDEKSRIAPIETGIPASAYHPVAILDPGPDGKPGTFDDRPLTVYAQDPASFGKDRQLLTNPAGLRTLTEGTVAEMGVVLRQYQFRASFVAEKSWGPTNPGNSPWENDPGVPGALFLDPNDSINAAGRSYFDRAYVGKIQFSGALGRAWGAIEWAHTVTYMDGLPFARRLLVAGLPQGPFLVDATVRGSPEGGNRAEHVLNWNARLSRSFQVARGRLRLALDLMNLANSAHRTQEIDTSGPRFNQRLPLAIQPARYVRAHMEYGF